MWLSLPDGYRRGLDWMVKTTPIFNYAQQDLVWYFTCFIILNDTPTLFCEIHRNKLRNLIILLNIFSTP